ncbi:DUF192 domain-containing protein [Salinimicrobium gaetbulicola]|uniref:DUF192 domain-containing protein n=1 Tax=Salinimicrobium gaetbulicola TaxID=999702 RepID=A0ABW3II67_9FLAO
MVRKYSLLSLLLLGGFFIGCKEEMKSPGKQVNTQLIEFKKEGEVYLTNTSGDTLAHLEVEIADDTYQRETGLMYRQSLQENRGMLFIFDTEAQRGFYMKNTNIPLDLIFLDSDLKVVSIGKDAKPHSLETIPSNEPAQYVLEVNAGLSDQWKLEPGDRLNLIRN